MWCLKPHSSQYVGIKTTSNFYLPLQLKRVFKRCFFNVAHPTKLLKYENIYLDFVSVLNAIGIPVCINKSITRNKKNKSRNSSLTTFYQQYKSTKWEYQFIPSSMAAVFWCTDVLNIQKQYIKARGNLIVVINQFNWQSITSLVYSISSLSAFSCMYIQRFIYAEQSLLVCFFP